MKKILCGILYCGEPQFEECVQAITNQKGVLAHYFVIENMPNKEAHNLLYAKFSNQSSEYDYCVKIDADMVLVSPYVLLNSINEFNQYPEVTHFICGVMDYFSGAVIHGMHFFKTGHKHKEATDSLFVDYVNGENTLSLVNKTPYVANHSFKPSSEQSFHFGIHKASKMLQKRSEVFDERAAQSHFRKIRGMTKVFLKSFSFLHFCSLLGAYRVIAGQLDERAIEYSYYRKEDVFKKFCFLKNLQDCFSFLAFICLLVINKYQRLLDWGRRPG